jgi:uncharacterized RDD family membrane protein YckC
MRCPKCSYLSYDDVERCRNCGYDFALATAARPPDAAVPVDPAHEPRTWEPPRRRRAAPLETTPPPEGAALDLPLFEDPGGPEPPPVVIPPAAPPLSVRRRVEIARPSSRLESLAEPAGVPGGEPEFDWPDEATTVPEFPAVPDAPGPRPAEDDGLGPRVRAGLVDAVLLVAIDVMVVWLTLRVAGVGAEEWRLLPIVPLIGFLFLLDTAYLVTFTAASGQTIGKMLAGVRVVYGNGGRVPFGHAVLRSVALLVCAIPLGLGLLPMFMDAERRGLHDRLAGTRVVPSA